MEASLSMGTDLRLRGAFPEPVSPPDVLVRTGWAVAAAGLGDTHHQHPRGTSWGCTHAPTLRRAPAAGRLLRALWLPGPLQGRA